MSMLWWMFSAARLALAAPTTPAPCTWDAAEPCYLQIGGVYEFMNRAALTDESAFRTMNDCHGYLVQPYIDAVNSLNGGRGFMVHSNGLEIAQSRPYQRYYYRLNYTRVIFENWTQGQALSLQLFPHWSLVLGMGSGCSDSLIMEQALLANITERLWMTIRGPWSQMSRASGGPLRWAFSAHLNSRDYPKGTIQQWALNGAKTAAIFYWCCSNDFFKGVGEGAFQPLEENGVSVQVVAQVAALGSSSLPSEWKVLEDAVAEAVQKKVDVIVTSFSKDALIFLLQKLEEKRHEYVPKGIYANNVVWADKNATYCQGLGLTCSNLLSASQVSVTFKATDALQDGVLSMDGKEYRSLPGFMNDFETATALSAFIQAVQKVFQFREVAEPSNPLHSAADPNVYMAVRDLMLSGQVFGSTFGGPASFNPWGQLNGMNPPTFSLSPDPKELSVLFPPSLADVGFEFPAPAAVPCVANFYKVWKKDSCLLCEAECQPCPPHSERYDPAFQCSCSSGFFDLDSSCVECPEGAVCNTSGSVLETLHLSTGYWRYGHRSSDVQLCHTGDACLGGTAYGDDSCAVGHEGPRCQVCSERYYHDSGSSKCLACPSESLPVGAVQVFALTSLFLILLLLCFRRRIQRVLSRSVQNSRSKAKEVKTKVKITVSLLQLMNMLPGIFPSITWPMSFQSFLSTLGIFNLSLFQVVPANCLRPTNFYDQLVATTLFPIGILLILALIYFIHSRLRGGPRGPLQSTYFGAGLLVTYLVFPFTVTTIFDTFKCEEFPLGTGDTRRFLAKDLSLDCDAPLHGSYTTFALIMVAIYPLGIPGWIGFSLWRYRRAIAPKVSLYEMSEAQEELEGRQSTVLRAKLVQKLGLQELTRKLAAPKLTAPRLVSMHTGRQYKGMVSQESGYLAAMKKREENPDIEHLRFIFEDYKPSSMYYEMFECLRKVFLSAVLVFCVPGSWLQIVVGLLFCLFSLKVLQVWRPYANLSANTAAESSQWILFASLLFGLLLFTAEQTSREIIGLDFGPGSFPSEFMSFFLIVATISSFIFGLFDAVMETEILDAADLAADMDLGAADIDPEVDPEHHGSGSGSEGSAAEGSEAADLGADLGAFEEERV
ncbi:Uncharacterized protein SCF082_LOCUS14372 [Durusdinium trenchii]|uniref:Uncharacterized protein n=1 Tax=Durusdinium trenchii TaxID=1381693 RepID=A0ABP0JXZ8_9DINO